MALEVRVVLGFATLLFVLAPEAVRAQTIIIDPTKSTLSLPGLEPIPVLPPIPQFPQFPQLPQLQEPRIMVNGLSLLTAVEIRKAEPATPSIPITLYEVGSLVPSPKQNKNVKEVDLSKYFRPQIEIQQVGSCHVYTGVAFVEAYCRQKFDYDLNLAEEYYFYRVIRENLAPRNSDKQLEDFGYLERAFAAETVRRIAQGEVAFQKDFERMSDDYYSFERTARRTLRDFNQNAQKNISARMREEAGQSSSEESTIVQAAENQQALEFKALPEEVGQLWDCDLQSRCHAQLGDNQSGPGMVVANAVLDPKLEDCLESAGSLKNESKPTKEFLTGLLDQGKFFMCHIDSPKNYASLFSDSYAFVKYHGGPSSVVHVAIVYGYRQLGKKVEFLVRDSNLKDWPGYVVNGCNSVDYFEK